VLDPPGCIIENGQWLKIITEETYAQVAEFFRKMDSIHGAVHRLTIMEDRMCSLVFYPDLKKDDLIILKCLAIAGTDDETWYGIDYYGEEHIIRRELMFP